MEQAASDVAYDSKAGHWVLAVAVLGSGMAFLDGTVVNVALPDIGRDFGASTSALQWILNGYLLTLASLILLGGSLGDRYGRRRVFVARGRPLHGRLAAVRDCAQRRDAGRREAAAGHRRRASDPGQPGDHRVQLSPRRPRPGDRRLVRAGRRRGRARTVARRLSGRGGLLAGDLPDQPPARRLRRLAMATRHVPETPRPDRERPARPRAVRCWPRSVSPGPPTP